MIKRIAITGPESTGKSELARQLANHYKTSWVPEYARMYLGRLDRKYVAGDLPIMAHKPHEKEEEAMSSADRFLFCDTEFIVFKIWSEDKFGSCDPWILEMADKARYSLYLLCDIDLPWSPDKLREDPGRREILFDRYLKELKSRNLPFKIISGIGNQRLQHAINAIDETF